MKVRDLIKGTAWTPGVDYLPGRKPAISILLPTFRRGASGLFRKAVESVLNQTLKDIELIIVDDASTDGTAEQIAEFMQADGRISCLRHAHNIGLPAISEFEAFTKARADFIAFAFDDDFFYPDALERLLEQSREHPEKVCFGSVIWRLRDKNSNVVQSGKLGQSLAHYNIRSCNSIPNCGVLLRRAVINDVGFYDPHILMTRICDWDLWRRISERYLLHYVDVLVGEVTGPETDDSLGKTYLLPWDAAEERMRASCRNLTPGAYLDVDIFEKGPETSSLAQVTISDLAAAHLERRPWLKELPSFKLPSQTRKAFVLTASHTASTSLCFDWLPRETRGQVRVILSQGGFALSELAHASCLIVVRLLAIHKKWIEAAHALKIPVYYFLDDNLSELTLSEGLKVGENFSVQALRSKLSEFTGVLVSTFELAEYFRNNLIHQNIQIFPVSYAETPLRLPAKDNSDFDVVIASLSGQHRQRGLIDSVLPALKLLARAGTKIHFVMGGCSSDGSRAALLEEISSDKNLKITQLPFSVDITQAQMQIAEYRPDVLIHGPSKTANNKYKTLNIALSAYILDCVLVVPDHPPFDSMLLDGAAIRIEHADEPLAWSQVVQKLLSAREAWTSYKQQNAKFCRTHFSGEQNIAVLKNMLEAAPPVTATSVEMRLKELCGVKTSSAVPQLACEDTLKASLAELLHLRAKKQRGRWLKPGYKSHDFFPLLSSAFEDLRKDAVKREIYTGSRRLQLSEDIHKRPYAEYPVIMEKGWLDSATCAFASEGVQSGEVGIELISPDGQIALNTAVDLSSIDLSLPVKFNLEGLAVVRPGEWHVRFFARSSWPVYVLEIVEYSRIKSKRRVVAPFMKFHYA
jgi:glycosyltransferase involved in cell wall biosynthesis